MFPKITWSVEWDKKENKYAHCGLMIHENGRERAVWYLSDFKELRHEVKNEAEKVLQLDYSNLNGEQE